MEIMQFTYSLGHPASLGGLFCAIGNPLNDGTWTYTWQNGRQLVRMQSVDVDASFVYNENGLRVQKTVNGVVTKYTLHGKNVVHMTQGGNELHFFYDAQNKPAIVVYNGVPYSYVKTLQGDVVALLDSTGAVVVKYVYDAWGRPISKTGNMAGTLGTVQPFRYRGYVYDEETGLYYLRSRYYNIVTCRFINADMLCVRNLFTYCKNAPVRSLDSNGAEECDVYLNVYHPSFELLFHINPLRVGHTDLQVGDQIYSFGRYGETWGLFDMKGMGILKVGDADMLLSDQAASHNKRVIRVHLRMSQDQVNTLQKKFDDIISNASEYDRDGLPEEYDYYRLPDDYDLFKNNCTTFSMGLLYDIYGDEMDGMEDAWAPYQLYHLLTDQKRESFIEFIYPTYDSYIE